LQSLKVEDLALLLDQTNKGTYDDASKNNIIAESLSDIEKLVAVALYYPLQSRVIFHKSLAWELCRDPLSEKIDVW